MEVVGLIPTWNSEIVLVVPSPITKATIIVFLYANNAEINDSSIKVVEVSWKDLSLVPLHPLATTISQQ